MQIDPSLVVAITGIAVWGIIEFWIRWRAPRTAARALDRALHPEQDAAKPPALGARESIRRALV
jgi:hypothetical protein